MKHFKTLILIIASIFILQGCDTTEEAGQPEVMVDSTSIKEVIEDFDSYVAISDSDNQSTPFPPTGCKVYERYLDRLNLGEIDADPGYEKIMENVDWKKYVEFSNNLKAGEIKRKEIYSGVYSSLSLLLTPRYDYSENDRDEMNKCIEGVGYLSLFKVFDDSILWGRIQCTGGVGFTEEQKPGITKDIEECEKVREELLEYQEA